MCKHQVVAVGFRGERRVVDLSDSDDEMDAMTVGQMKRKIIDSLKIDRDVALVFGNSPLEEDKLLRTCAIKHMSRISLVVRLPGGL